MSISRAGLKQVVACNAGTLATTPGNPIALGLRQAATMEIGNFKQVNDYLNRPLRNMKNFKVEGESLQPTLKMLKAMLGWTNLNCDLQVITRPQASGGTGDVYKFIGNDKLGLDIEYMISGDKRSLKAIWEGAMEFDRAKTLIDGADNASPVSIDGITGEGADFTKYRAPYFLSFESPKTTATFAHGDIKERSYSIKTKNTKSVYNTSIVHYLVFEFKIIAYDASVAKKVELMAKDMSPSIFVKEQNASSTLYDCFDFNAGVLALSEVFTNKDDERIIEMVFSGDVHIFDTAFEFGAGKGGDITDTEGIIGGTMKIGY